MKEEIKIGDLITTYWKGFYEVTRIERRWENKKGETYYERYANCLSVYDPETCGDEINPLYHFIQKYSSEGKPVKLKTIKSCDTQFCKLAKDFIPIETKRLQNIIDNLNNIKY